MKPILLILLLFLLIPPPLRSQDGQLPLEHFTTVKAEIMMGQGEAKPHTAIKPTSYWTVQRFIPEPDSVEDAVHMAFKHRDEIYLNLSPRLNIGAYNQSGSSHKTAFMGEPGIGMALGIRNKFYLKAEGLYGYSNPPIYMQAIADSLMAFPGMNYKSNSNAFAEGFYYKQWGMMAAYKASQHFEFFIGRGKHFIGEGYRSVILSDFAGNYNYFRADMDVWQIKYMFLGAQMNQSDQYPVERQDVVNKYAVIHYLSLHLTDRWNIGLFESVLWEAEDSIVQRDFDINYLNPAIFFRPVEYGMGSSDNSLLGFQSSLNPSAGLTLYGQVMLDEFLFGEWSAPFKQYLVNDANGQRGYWANKQAYQLGFKVHEPLSWKNASVLAEVDVVRPFTFGHSNTRQSYTHMNQSLAHPMGANFVEWVQVTTWMPGSWRIALFSTYSRKGYSNQLGFMGEDPLVSNMERDENNREYGNFTTQGRRSDLTNLRLTVGYNLVESWNLRVEGTVHYRHERRHLSVNEMVFIGIGVRTALWNEYKNL